MSLNSPIHIAVLMTCYNRKETTIKCLSYLFNSKFTSPNAIDFQVFLVDDGSKDGTPEAIQTLFPEVHISHGNGNLYWNRGMHSAWLQALKQEEFDFYLWLNDDTYIYENSIETMVETILRKNNNGIIGGFLKATTENKVTYGGIKRNGQMLQPNGLAQTCFELNGNCVLIPLKVTQKIGIIDPIYPHALGDFDYAHRVRNAGFKCWLTTDIVGECDANSDLPIWCNQKYPLIKRLQQLYTPKAYSHPYYQFLFEKKYYGYGIAAKHFLTIHLRAFFPNFWQKTF